MIRRAYIRKMEDRLERLEYDFNDLRNRMATPEGDNRGRIDQEIRDFQTKAEVVRKRIRAVEAAGASSWGHLKYAVDEGLKELGKIAIDAAERFRNTGSGDR